MVSTSPAPLARRNAAALLYSSELKQATPPLECRELDHHEAMELVRAFHDLETPTARENPAAVLGDDRGHQVGVFLVFRDR
jgi:hypothetical protein